MKTETRMPSTSSSVLPPVRSKQDFVRRYKAGEFGNHSPTWDTVEEYLASGYQAGLLHLRNRKPGGEGTYNVQPEAVEREADKLFITHGVSLKDLYVSAMAPTAQTTLQGELMLNQLGEWQLFYSHDPLTMRDALAASGRQAVGLTSRSLIYHHMNHRSRQWLAWLLHAYPEHVIEFSCYNRCWGTEPGFNTVFWEVRTY